MTEQTSPLLDVRDVSVSFGGLRALDHVSLSVPAGAIVGLIGPNGAGKTTLFNSIAGLTPVAGGSVLLLGRDVTRWSPHRRARLGLGRTFQRLELFGSLTVEENLIVAYESQRNRGGLFADLLALPASVETRADARDRAARVLDDLGLSRHSSTRAADLPIGLARSVELARALCAEPKLLLLDEPSSGLSVPESRALARMLAASRDATGAGVLLVEHDMTFVLGLCDHVYAIDFGRSLADGTPDRIRNDPAVQAAYLGEEVDVPAARG